MKQFYVGLAVVLALVSISKLRFYDCAEVDCIGRVLFYGDLCADCKRYYRTRPPAADPRRWDELLSNM